MPPPDFIPRAVRELQAGGEGGRYRERALGCSPDALALRNPLARTPAAQKCKASGAMAALPPQREEEREGLEDHYGVHMYTYLVLRTD